MEINTHVQLVLFLASILLGPYCVLNFFIKASCELNYLNLTITLGISNYYFLPHFKIKPMPDSGDKANTEQNWDGAQIFLTPKTILTNYAVLLIFTFHIRAGVSKLWSIGHIACHLFLLSFIGTQPHPFTDYYSLTVLVLPC